MSGYHVGPTLNPGESPWPLGWEQDPTIDDGHRHAWETVLLPQWKGRAMQECVRCSTCHAPRCGHTTDEDPCMKRRHHDGWHLFSSGRTEMVGA